MAFLQSSLYEALRTGQYSDLTIGCQGREWKVHRLVIGNRSNLLNHAGNTQWIEAQTRHVNLDEEDPVILHRVLYYIYTGNLVVDYSEEYMWRLYPLWSEAVQWPNENIGGDETWSRWVNGSDEPSDDEDDDDYDDDHDDDHAGDDDNLDASHRAIDLNIAYNRNECDGDGSDASSDLVTVHFDARTMSSPRSGSPVIRQSEVDAHEPHRDQDDQDDDEESSWHDDDESSDSETESATEIDPEERLDSLSVLDIIIQLYSAADRLSITGLKDAAKSAFENSFDPEEYLSNFDGGPFVEELLSIAIKIYSTTSRGDRGLRDAFLNGFDREQLAKFVRLEMQQSSSAFADRLVAAPDLAVDLIKESWRERSSDANGNVPSSEPAMPVRPAATAGPSSSAALTGSGRPNVSVGLSAPAGPSALAGSSALAGPSAPARPSASGTPAPTTRPSASAGQTASTRPHMSARPNLFAGANASDGSCPFTRIAAPAQPTASGVPTASSVPSAAAGPSTSAGASISDRLPPATGID